MRENLAHLFECLSTQVDMNSLTTNPMFFFFSVADKSLAYSKIMTEWLSTAKYKSVDLAEESFVHGSLVKFFLVGIRIDDSRVSTALRYWPSFSQMLRCYSLHGAVGWQLKQPGGIHRAKF